MATVINAAIVLSVPPTVLGPDSEYEKQRLKLKTEHAQLVVDAQKVTQVTNAQELELANNAGRVLQVASKECEEFFKPIKQQIDALKKPVLNAETEISNLLATEKARLGGLITAFQQEEKRRADEAARVAREAAEAAERERLLNLAVEAEKSGDIATAEAILDEPVTAPPITIQHQAPTRMAGQVSTTRYSCTVTNLLELVQAVADGKAKIGCISANEAYLNNQARADKENFSIPGCQLNRSSGTHFRG